MQLSSLLTLEAVHCRLRAGSKKQALRLLAESASERAGLSQREIFRVLMERELHGSTGMGGGVSIPHGRFEALDSSLALFALLEKPVEFGAADERPVDLMFMLLTPLSSNNEHIRALSLVSKLLRDRVLCEKLRAASDTETLYTLLMSHTHDE